MIRGLISKLTERSTAERVGRHYAGPEILRREDWANFFGVQSCGVGQIRGNGPLLLTPGVLHFFLLMPKREVRIELADITRTDTVSSFLGRRVGRPLLLVGFGTGQTADSAAWWVADPHGWRREIDERRTQ
jgi:hypothetical protein